MESHEAFQKVTEQVSPKQLADDLGISLSTLHKWSEAGESHRSNPLDYLEAVRRATNDLSLLHWQCEQAGGHFVPNPPPAATAKKLLPALCQVEKELTATLQLLAVAAEDQRIPAAEANELRAAWERAKPVMEGFVLACERGSFRCVALFYPLMWWLVTGDSVVVEG